MPDFINHISLLLRSQNRTAAASALRSVIRKVKPGLRTKTITTMAAVVANSMVGIRSQTRLLGIFPTMALFLAAIGIYGVLSCSVAEPTHEIGLALLQNRHNLLIRKRSREFVDSQNKAGCSCFVGGALSGITRIRAPVGMPG